MKDSFLQKLRCPRTHVALRKITEAERAILALPAHQDALIGVDQRFYYLIDQGMPTLLPDSALAFPAQG